MYPKKILRDSPITMKTMDARTKTAQSVVQAQYWNFDMLTPWGVSVSVADLREAGTYQESGALNVPASDEDEYER